MRRECLKSEELDLPRASLSTQHQWIAFDCGYHLLKCVYPIAEKYQEAGESVAFQTKVYESEHVDFESLLMEIKSRATFRDSGFPISISGIRSQSYKASISKVLGYEVSMDDNVLCCVRGVRELSCLLSEERLCHGRIAPALPTGVTLPKFITDSAKKKQWSEDGSLVIMLGAMSVHVVTSARSARVARNFYPGGWAANSYLGLARLLTGSQGYVELTELGEKGNRANVDTQIKEILANNQHSEDSPYGRYPPEMPTPFNFGKAGDHNLALESFKREDLAASLMNMYTNLLFYIVTLNREATGVNKIFIVGKVMDSVTMRTDYSRRVAMWAGDLETMFVKCESIACIGSILRRDEDENES